MGRERRNALGTADKGHKNQIVSLKYIPGTHSKLLP